VPRGQHETEARGPFTQRPQEPEDQHDVKYDNDCTKDWRVGFSKGSVESAEGKPDYAGGYRAPRGDKSGYRAGPPLRPGAKGPHR